MKSSIVALNCAVVLIAGILLLETSSTNAAPHIISSNPAYYSPMYSSDGQQQQLQQQNPEYILQALARLRQALIAEEELDTSKRGLDLGLGRGFSGSQAAKHLMGLAAANFAGGPGRRRRSANHQLAEDEDLV